MQVGGLYFLSPGPQRGVALRKYLPQVKAKVHTTVQATASRTNLRQTYVNPFRDRTLEEIKYAFPLFDGVTVVQFNCQVGDRNIKGVVKEKETAKAIYKEAKDQGQTAGLLEEIEDASDTFIVSIGNVPANERVVVDIAYVGELKHDAEIDGIRLTIPTVIAPRYGAYPGELLENNVADDEGMEIIVDIAMEDGSQIQKIQSPSHAISVTIGSVDGESFDTPSLSRGSATLTLGKTELHGDFILQIMAKNSSIPRAILETHRSIPNSRALMTTLVPKFSLKPILPEIIFIVDRSGSMRENISTLIAAMEIFLRSLPVGVKFNICSFGSTYEFLFPKSQSYSQKSLDQAANYVRDFESDFGGTETYSAVKACIKSRATDMPTEILLLTDGDIWAQEELFKLLNNKIKESSGKLRLFSLGIGSGVSHALIEGVARAGNGFAQTVDNGEIMDDKLVRMLKGALTPHVNNYTLEVKYKNDDSLEDFEIIEKVSDSLKVDLTFSDANGDNTEEKKKLPISLYNETADTEMNESNDIDSKNRFAHLPPVPVPKLLQAPHQIPPLFPFNRTTVYLLLSPELSHLIPVSVILRATSDQGPLELEIPVQDLEHKGETVHQLAAKKAIQELEEGRGWLVSAKDGKKDVILKEKYPSRFEEMVQRETIRLGVQFQITGKHCSFVAVDNSDKETEIKQDPASVPLDYLKVQTGINFRSGRKKRIKALDCGLPLKARKQVASVPATLIAQPTLERMMPRESTSAKSFGSGSMRRRVAPPGNGLFNGSAMSNLDSASPISAVAVPSTTAYERARSGFVVTQQHSVDGSEVDIFEGSLQKTKPGEDVSNARTGIMLESASPNDSEAEGEQEHFHNKSAAETDVGTGLVRRLISLQHFCGSWTLTEKLPTTEMNIDRTDMSKAVEKLKGIYKPNMQTDKTGFARDMEELLTTVVVVTFLEKKMNQKKDTWELVVEKARNYVEKLMNDICDNPDQGEIWKIAYSLLPKG